MPRAPLWTAAGTLARPQADGRLECVACAHGCVLGRAWVGAVFTAARARGLVTVVVSDGNTTAEALAATVLDAIGTARALGYWVEVVTAVRGPPRRRPGPRTRAPRGEANGAS